MTKSHIIHSCHFFPFFLLILPFFAKISSEDSKSNMNNRIKCLQTIKSASHKLKALLMFPQDVMSTIRTVMGLIKTWLHQEGEAAEQRSDTATDGNTPHIGGISWFQVYNGHDCVFAAGTGESGRVIEVWVAGLGRSYLAMGGAGCWMMTGGGAIWGCGCIWTGGCWTGWCMGGGCW